MKPTRFPLPSILLLALPAALAAQPLRISVYAPAGTVNRYLSTAEDRAAAAKVMQRFRASKIWIEGRRGDEYVKPELLAAARDDFRARGLLVSGGLTTVAGKTFGVQSNQSRTWLNFQAAKTQADITRFYTENAAIFDEIMVDDFYASDDTSPESEKARGSLPWSDYRRKLLVSLIGSTMLEPARAVRPGTRVIIKFPQWYEGFHLRGYDPPATVAVADGIWIGTETRNPHTPAYGYVQPSEGYINFRWLASFGGGKTGGAWFDHLDCTPRNFVDQAYQSVLAGARELTLFNLNDLMRGHPGQPLLEAALPELFDLAEKVRGRAAEGVHYYKPAASDGGENAYLMDYLAMVGLPIVPESAYPAGAKVLVLGRQAGADPRLLEQIRRHLDRGATLVLTPALIRMLGKPAADLAGVSVTEQPQLVQVAEAEVGGRRLPLQKPLEIDAGFESSPGTAKLAVFSGGRRIPLATSRKSGKGRILVWNLATFKSGASLAPAELGLPEIPQPLAEALREQSLAPLKVRLQGPAKAGFYMFPDACAFFNFRDEPVTLKLNGRPVELGANRILWRAKAAQKR